MVIEIFGFNYIEILLMVLIGMDIIKIYLGKRKQK